MRSETSKASKCTSAPDASRERTVAMARRTAGLPSGSASIVLQCSRAGSGCRPVSTKRALKFSASQAAIREPIPPSPPVIM